MGLRFFLILALLLGSSCAVKVEGSVALGFNANIAAMGRLTLTGTGTVVSFNQSEGLFTAPLETYKVTYAWTESKALARRIDGLGARSYCSLEIKNGAVYHGIFAPLEDDITRNTPADTRWLN